MANTNPWGQPVRSISQPTWNEVEVSCWASLAMSLDPFITGEERQSMTNSLLDKTQIGSSGGLWSPPCRVISPHIFFYCWFSEGLATSAYEQRVRMPCPLLLLTRAGKGARVIQWWQGLFYGSDPRYTFFLALGWCFLVPAWLSRFHVILIFTQVKSNLWLFLPVMWSWCHMLSGD